jgi:hypothetical protein
MKLLYLIFLLHLYQFDAKCVITSNPALLSPKDPFWSITGFGFKNKISLQFDPPIFSVDYDLAVSGNFIMLTLRDNKSWHNITGCGVTRLYIKGITIDGLECLNDKVHVATIRNQLSEERRKLANSGPFSSCEFQHGQDVESRIVDAYRQANEDKSDKVALHNYELMYGVFLAPFMLASSVRLLEVGVFEGHSLQLWSNLFPGISHVYGVGTDSLGPSHSNNSLEKKQYSDKITIYAGDQSNRTFLRHIVKDMGRESIDIIIDDGSHIPWHQILTFEILFQHLLAPGGIYIIEDIETSYYDHPNARTYGLPVRDGGVGNKKGSVVEKFKTLVDVLNRRYLLTPRFTMFGRDIDHMISSVSFGRNCIIIRKGNPANGWTSEVLRHEMYPWGRMMSKNRTHVWEYVAQAKVAITGYVPEES